MTHVDQLLLAPVVARFGPPERWDGSREISARNAATIARSSARGRAHDVTFVIRSQDARIVIVRKPQFPPGAWRIPSGGVDRGESFEAGTLREALEETGLEIELTGYPLVAESAFTHAGAVIPWTSHVVTATASSETLAPQDRVEIEDARWAPMAELTGSVAGVLRASGSPLFLYRADLHDRIAAAISA
jgi:ADP-ribose pyrophosphatase YjhB (NUDIX family)